MIDPPGAARAAIPTKRRSFVACRVLSEQSTCHRPRADFGPCTEAILILPQCMLVYNRAEYGTFRLYSLSGAHWAAIPVSAFSIVSRCKLLHIMRNEDSELAYQMADSRCTFCADEPYNECLGYDIIVTKKPG